jgi:hypothetical protein
VREGWRKLHGREIRNLFALTIIGVRWAERVEQIGKF